MSQMKTAGYYYYTVITNAFFDKILTYKSIEYYPIGTLVEVSVRNRPALGVILDQYEDHTFAEEKTLGESSISLASNINTSPSKKFTIKEISQSLGYTYKLEYLSFLQKAAKHSMIPLGALLDMGLLNEKSLKKTEELPSLPTYNFKTVCLNEEQEQASRSIIQAANIFQVFLLDGVTGSGKTEVYFTATHHILNQNKKIIILLPEIALTEAIVKRFTSTFGEKPFIWHSNITPANKRKLWKTLQQKGPAVILGARSALFIPLPDLGLIIVDEEHDSSYKQEEQGIYNARDFAILRANLEQCPIVLASATPSLETWAHTLSGKYAHLLLSSRFGEAQMPFVQIIDKKQYPKQLITAPLYKAIQDRLEKNEQTLLFLNRRGFSPLLVCFSCGYRFECPGCHVELTIHKERNIALCHYCGYHMPAPTQCPSCQHPQIKELGWGVEKVTAEAQKLFPQANILCVSSDQLENPKESKEIFNQIESRNVDIIVGTQVLAKGHHFPYLTCVGILDADKGLSQLDLRAGEKTFQLLSQVAGRAGRMASHKGLVVLQTRAPDSPLYEALKKHDRNAFYQLELEEREESEMPPFTRLISITVSSLREDMLINFSRQLASLVPFSNEVEIYGPTPAALYRLRSRYRMKFLIKGPKNKNIQEFTKKWLQQLKPNTHIQLNIDVYPLSFV